MPLGESMLLTLKNNDNLRRLKKKFTTPFLKKSKTKETLFNFPEATPELLEKIRLQIKIQEREDIIIYLLSLMVTFIVFVILLV